MEFRKCYIDSEMLQLPGIIPLPELAERPVISVTIYDNYSKKYITTLWRKDFKPHVEKDASNKTVVYTNSEESLFKTVWSILGKMFPDFYTGYNVWFDLNYLTNRSIKLNVPTFIKVLNKHVTGALVLDFKHAYEEIYTQTSYDLDHILEVEGFGAKQTDVNKIPYYYEHDIKSLIKHNRDEDVEGLVWLDEKLDLTGLYLMIKSEIAGFNDLNKNVFYFNQILDQILLRLAREENEIMPSRPKEGYKSYAGAIVLEPKPGIHKNVAVFDQEKFYPSIFKTYYIMLCKKQTLTNEEEVMKQILKYIVKIYDILLKYRLSTEKQMTQYTPGTKEYSRLENRRQKMKGLTNSVYGFVGYYRSRIKNYAIAEMITERGRKVIEWDIKQFQSRGYEAIYGDTDSVFVPLKTENVEKEALKLAKEVSATLSDFVKQEFRMSIPSHKLALAVDKIFSSVLFVEDVKSKKRIKKRYGGTICLANLKKNVIWKSRGRNVPIGEIKIGDKLIAYDLDKGKLAETEVKQIMTRDCNDYLRIVLEPNNGKRGSKPAGGEHSPIIVTVEHPFFVKGKWKRTDELTAFDELFFISREEKQKFRAKIDSVYKYKLGKHFRYFNKTLEKKKKVSLVKIVDIKPSRVRFVEAINLHCEPYNNFFVNGVLVHNCWKSGHYLEKPYLYIRGFEFVRRDQSQLTKQVQGKIIELVNNGDAESIKKLIFESVNAIKNNLYDIDYIAINKTIQKRFEDYKVKTDFLKGTLWANKYLKTNIVPGSMVKQIFVKTVRGFPITQVICYTNKQLLPLKNIVLNKEKMIERTLKSPLDKIIRLVGLSFDECLGQKTLIQSFKQPKKDGVV